MTLHVLHAGDGYSYLTDQVASHDREREAGQDMAEYYLAHGTPPGRWWGAGLDALADPAALIGHPHEALAVAGVVDEAQMKALFGEGLHPNADALIEHLIETGMSAEDAVKTARLGRKFPAYANEIPLLVRTDAAVKRHTSEHGRRPSLAETRQIERDIADQLFTDDHGRPPRTDRELASWMVNEKAKVRQPVAGFDLVFTPAKSVSVLWGLGDDTTRRAVADAHHAAVTDSLEWLQHDAIYTRTGDAGERQIDTRGITVAMFDHFDNRAGDPNFHTHATVSVKVQGDDGVWRSIDSKALHRHAVAASQRYNARIMTELRARLGVGVTVRSMGEGKQPVLEVAGIDEGVRDMFSSRRSEIEARHEVLVRDYRDKHSKMPSDKASYALFQQATLDTRQGKPPARSLAEMRGLWRDKAITHLGSPEAVEAMLARTLDPARATSTGGTAPVEERVFAGPLAESAAVVSHLEDRKATWTEPMIRGAVEAHLAPLPFVTEDHRRAAIEDTIAAARDQSIALRTPEFAATPAALQRRDGQSQLTRHGELLHTSARVLAAESDLLDATRTPTAHIVTNEVIDRECAKLAKKSGRELNTGQRALVEHFTASGPMLRVGVGPAGAGKTTAMRATAKAWEATGRNVLALAPAKAAADLLGSEIGATGAAVAAITYAYRGRLADKGIPAGTITDFYDSKIRQGTMLLVDEASMAATADLHALTQIARERGAIVCALGDPYQLDAVETGGMFRLLADESHAPALTEVVRFGDDHVQADNSLKVRHGDHSAVDMFTDRGWIHPGTATELKTQIVADHLADTATGASGVLMAGTVDDVRDLNYAVQQHHRAAGTAATRRTTALSDQHTAGRGDQIITRTNDRIMRVVGGTRKGATVANGDLWTVKKVHRDGSLTVTHTNHRGKVTLAPDYVKKSVELGYAVTVHRAQGVTVDYARGLVQNASRRLLYVLSTRGATANHLYVPTDQNVLVDTEGAHLDPTGRAPEPADVLRAALDNDEGHRAATTELRDALAAAHDPERLASHYHAGQRLLRDAYLDHILEQAVPGALLETMRTAHPDSYHRLRGLLAGEHDRGGHPVHVLVDALGAEDSLTDAHDPAAVVVSRIDTTPRSDTDRDPHALAPPPPHHPGADTELADWCAVGATAHADAITGHRDPVAAALADYRTALAADRDARLEAAVSALPVDVGYTVRFAPDLDALHARLLEAGHAGYTPEKVTAVAARELATAERDITAAAIAEHIGATLPRAMAHDRTRWLADNAIVGRQLDAAGIDPAAPAIADVLDDIRFRERVAGDDPALVVSGWTAAARPSRDRANPTVDTAALSAAWHDKYPDPYTVAASPDAPTWVTPPPVGDVTATDRYRVLADTVRDAGEQMATDRPVWADALGDYPTDPGAQRRWHQVAGHAAAWRSDHDIDTDDTPLGPTPPPEHRQAYERLLREVDELRHRTGDDGGAEHAALTHNQTRDEQIVREHTRTRHI